MIFQSYDYQISENDKKYLLETYKSDKYLKGNYYTGYHTHYLSQRRKTKGDAVHSATGKEDDRRLVGMYSKFLAKCLKDQGLSLPKMILSYNHIWAQIYLKEKGSMNAPHNHFLSSNTVCSWIHFVDVPEDQDCLYFQIGDTKVYPKEQRSGTLVFFPAWAMHGVDPITTTSERMVVAGNVNKIL